MSPEKNRFELIIVPKDGVIEKNITKESDRYTVSATNHLWYSDANTVQMVPQMYRERWSLKTDTSAKAVRPRRLFIQNK